MLRSSVTKRNATVPEENILSAPSGADAARGLGSPQEDGAVAEQAVIAVPDFPVDTASIDEGVYPLEAAEREEIPAPTASLGEIGQIYRQMVEAATAIFDAAAKKMVPDSVAIIGAVRQAYVQLRQGDELLAEIVRQRRNFRSWPERAANVAILSMRLGMEMETDKRRCLALGLCGLMHDVGMLTIPPAVLDKFKLSSKQLKLLHQHPVRSQQIIQGFGASFAWIGNIVVQVHERCNGLGYPRGLKGEKIHEVARILGLADAYEAMAHPRPDRKAQAMYNAVKEIIDQRNAQFDRRIIKALIHIVSIFPLGSLVRLNNGKIGRVIAVSRIHPTRPTVEIMVDSQGQHLAAPEVLVLEDEPMIYIVNPAIEEEALKR